MQLPDACKLSAMASRVAAHACLPLFGATFWERVTGRQYMDHLGEAPQAALCVQEPLVGSAVHMLWERL